jgi:hypothetical protein
MNLRVPHPLRSLQRVGYANVGIEILDPSQKTARMGHPEVGGTFCRRPFHVPWVGDAGDNFEECRIKFVGPTKPRRKFGGMGHLDL